MTTRRDASGAALPQGCWPPPRSARSPLRAAAERRNRHAALRHHQSAAAMGTPRAAGHLSRSRHHHHRSVVRSAALGITAIHRVATGFPWAEGPAWSSEGQYFVFSDVSGNTQYRVLWDDRRVTPFRKPSNNSNGNSFDFQGRQISTEDFFRRVIRWEHDGTMTVIADSVRRQAAELAERSGAASRTAASGSPIRPMATAVGGPSGRTRAARPIRRACSIRGSAQRTPARSAARSGELPNAVYRWDPSGRLDQVITEDQLKDPNGICFSPDYKTLYVISTGKGPGDTHSGGTRHDPCVRRAGQQAGQRPRVPRHDGGRRALRPGRHARRRVRQSVVQLERAARLCRRAGLQRARQADRPHPAAGGVREPVLRRPEAQPAVDVASQSIYLLQVQTQGAAPG